MLERLSDRLERPFQSWYRRVLSAGTASKGLLTLLFATGLIIRAVGLFGLGDADMEDFKSWAVLTQSRGLQRMYSAPDAALLDHARRHGTSIGDSFNALRTSVHFIPLEPPGQEAPRGGTVPYGYYMVMYPPVSVYMLHWSGTAYRFISGTMENSRLFNVFISFPMLLASIFITWVIFFFFRTWDHRLAVAAAVFYWLNPIVLLDSTILGYDNPLYVLFTLPALMLLYRRRYLPAVLMTALALWVKPQGILLLPITAAVCLKETKARMWPVYLAAILLVSLVILWPFVVSGAILSALLGTTIALRDLGVWAVEVLSARNWNLWWIIKVLTYRIFGEEAILPSNFATRFGADPKVIGSALMIFVWLLSLAQLFKKLPVERVYIFLSMIMMGYAYTMVQINVQFNQFFVFIPPLLLIALLSRRLFAMTFLVSLPWFIQFLAYGGLGRDFCCLPDLFRQFGATKLFTGASLLIAVLNIVLWLLFCWQYFAGQLIAQHVDHRPGNSQGESTGQA
ncbi:MAG: hypothetical protein HY315_03640 [Acidobacteria bacterium]|nr:hypothetical protein [Acidobacteriota bacterium]